jgi:hypothetical protein
VEEKSPGFLEDEEGYVCLTSRNGRIRYFMKRMSLLIPFIQEGIRCTMIKATYWWYGMKRDVAKYIALCGTCQRVKAEHQ